MSFYSDRLTDRKYGLLFKRAISLRDVRNELSLLVNSDLMKYLSMSKIDFQKAMLPLIKDRIHSNFTKQVCDDVFNCYQNRFSAIQKRMMFEKVKSLEMTFYKRNTKDKKKGDPKGIIRTIVYYPLSLGRNFDELKRIIIGLQTADAYSVALPADWRPGDDVIVPTAGSCGVAKERMESTDADQTCYDWFFCTRKLPKEKVDALRVK